jgi:Flp pilus assembly protein TadG
MRRRMSAADEQGTITLWILGLCMMMLLLGGISLDLWRAFSERRALAAAADAAAVAGASAIDESWFRETGEVRLDVAEARLRAAASLRGQGDVRALHDFRVVTSSDAITVEVRGVVDFTLLHLASPGDPLEIRIQATAQPVRAP